MATKKKAAKKAIPKMIPAAIFIQLDGSPFPLYTSLDGNEKKHPSKVFWQAVNLAQSYQIVLDQPPAPFKNGSGPFPTNQFGTTQTLKVDKNYADGEYGYTIKVLIRSRWQKLSGGGIIIES
jgi:hypothetical protein